MYVGGIVIADPRNSESGKFGIRRVRYAYKEMECRVNLVILLCIAEEVKELPCVMMHMGNCRLKEN